MAKGGRIAPKWECFKGFGKDSNLGNLGGVKNQRKRSSAQTGNI